MLWKEKKKRQLYAIVLIFIDQNSEKRIKVRIQYEDSSREVHLKFSNRKKHTHTIVSFLFLLVLRFLHKRRPRCVLNGVRIEKKKTRKEKKE